MITPTLTELTRTPTGADLLDRVHDTLTRYVVLPSPEAFDAVTLWIAATHAQPAWHTAPRLIINSPEPRCGKSRLLDVIEGTVHNPLMTMNISTAAIFRSIDTDDPPTLLLDEADAIWSTRKSNRDSAEDLRALINAGHGRGRPTIRCVGPAQVPTRFDTFCMVALAGIGNWAPDTVLDRGIAINMRRRSPDETVEQFRVRHSRPALDALRDALSTWVRSLLDTLGAAEPDLPVTDRAADTWEPLVAVADAAGGHWPERSRRACRTLCAAAEQEDDQRSIGARLLADIRTVFEQSETERVTSEGLVQQLREIEDAPWASWDLQPPNLARRLKPFGIRPDRIPPAQGRRQARGYRLEDFEDAWNRYLPGVVDPSSGVTASLPQISSSDGPSPMTDVPVTGDDTVLPLTCTDDALTDDDEWTPNDLLPTGAAL